MCKFDSAELYSMSQSCSSCEQWWPPKVLNESSHSPMIHYIHEQELTRNILKMSNSEVLGYMMALQSHSRKGSIDLDLRIAPFCYLDNVSSRPSSRSCFGCLGNYKPVHAILQSVDAGAGPAPDARKFPQSVKISVGEMTFSSGSYSIPQSTRLLHICIRDSNNKLHKTPASWHYCHYNPLA
jgi:hypothetical protein